MTSSTQTDCICDFRTPGVVDPFCDAAEHHNVSSPVEVKCTCMNFGSHRDSGCTDNSAWGAYAKAFDAMEDLGDKLTSLPTPEIAPEPLAVVEVPAPRVETPAPATKVSAPKTRQNDRAHKTIKLKRTDAVPSNNYTAVPNALLDAQMPPGPFMALVWLLRHQDGWETSVYRLAKSLGIKWDTAERHCLKLEELGYLTRSEGQWLIQTSI